MKREPVWRVRIDSGRHYDGDKTVRLNLRLREDQARFLRDNAQAGEISRSELLRQMIDLSMDTAIEAAMKAARKKAVRKIPQKHAA